MKYEFSGEVLRIYNESIPKNKRGRSDIGFSRISPEEAASIKHISLHKREKTVRLIKEGISFSDILKQVKVSKKNAELLWSIYKHLAPVYYGADLGSKREPYYKGDFPPELENYTIASLGGEELLIYLMMDSTKKYQHHIKAGCYYITDEYAFIQINDEWVPAIIYKSAEDEKKSFVRSREEFFEKFSEITD